MILARFIKAKSESTLSERQGVGRLKVEAVLRTLLSFFMFPWVGEKSRFSFKLSNLLPGFFFSGLVLCLPLSNIYPGFSGAWALLQFDPFPKLSQACALPLLWLPF